MKSLILPLLLLPNIVFANPQLKEIIKNMFGENPPKVETCEIDQAKWLNLLVSRETFVQKIVPKKGCDLKGEFSPKMDEFFPLNLQVLNNKDLTSFVSEVKISILFEEQAILRIDLKNSKLQGPKKLKEFDLFYKFAIDPFNEKSFIKEKLAGEITFKGKSPTKI